MKAEEIDRADFERFLFLKRGYSKGGIRTALKNFKQVQNWFIAYKLPITARTIEDFFVDKKKAGYKTNTLSNYYTTFRLLEHFTKKKLLGDIKPPKSKRVIPHILTEKELVKLFAVSLCYGTYQGKSCNRLDAVYNTLIRFLYYTGCRISEAVFLQKKNVLPNNQIHFVETKNNEDRTVYLFSPVYKSVQKLIEKSHAEDFVFRSMTGNHVSIPEFEKTLKSRAEKAGIKKRVYPHLLRHTLASHLSMAKVDVRVVQQILGHRDLNSTMYYTQMDKSVQIDAIHSLPLAQHHLSATERIERIQKNIETLRLEDDIRLKYSLRASKRYGKKGLILEVFEA